MSILYPNLGLFIRNLFYDSGKASSYIFNNKSIQTGEQPFGAKPVGIFATVATPIAMLYQVKLGSYIALQKPRTKCFCARDGDHFFVDQVKLLVLL